LAIAAASTALVIGMPGCDGDEDSTTSAGPGTSADQGEAAEPVTYELNGQTFHFSPPEANKTCQQLRAYAQGGLLDVTAKLAPILSRGRIDDEVTGLGTIAVKIADAQCPEYRPPQTVIEQLGD